MLIQQMLHGFAEVDRRLETLECRQELMEQRAEHRIRLLEQQVEHRLQRIESQLSPSSASPNTA
jgi:hypothetical protein